MSEVKGNETDKSPETAQSGKGTAKRRLLLLTVDLVLIMFSGLLICFFLLTVEIKKSGDDLAISADITASTLETKAAVSSADILISLQRRKELQTEMSELMDRMRFRMEHTQLEDIRWIFDTTTPDGLSSGFFHIYLGQSDGETWGRLKTGYILKRQIFLKKIEVDVDGTKYNIEIDFNDRDAKDLGYIDSVSEHADIPIWPYIDVLRHIGNGTRVRISLQGKGGTHDFQLTYDQIEAIHRVTRLYLIMQELES